MDALSDRYRRFAEVEADGVSPLYARLARHVAGSPSALSFLMQLPPPRRQPNLFFAAMRHVAGTPESPEAFDAVLRAHGPEIGRIMQARTTQTNEPGRCAAILPSLSAFAGPLALIEIGASAGLCLLPDAYGYDWQLGTGEAHRLDAPEPDLAPCFPCDAAGFNALPDRHPQIVWRAGLDLNPLDVTDDADCGWLETLVWPEQTARRDRLRAAIALARTSPPRIEKGDLRHDLDALVAEVPRGATCVIFHTAVLSYLPDRDDRAAFGARMASRDAVWISNEAPGVIPGIDPGPPPVKGQFCLSVNGTPAAWTGPHGQAVTRIG
ncbi:DUF2332 domain-containing protein [Oceanomicrobium pacificus]|uniref:DUF2332 family protein n=1 Tax=Oceanomicrobium pacificus TaxID=2692916 RepID=A0A6B0TTE0_9RHOB|nr:DUF2332 domain-containing protein [Oceanomicrobium pacificus]MXU64243.1 DUF2332 family protein [Oceanomicrobium pacificus]